VQLAVRASIDVRANVADALGRWSQRRATTFLPGGGMSGTVAFQALNEAESRVTVQLEGGHVASQPERAQLDLEQDLRAFKHSLEAPESAAPR